MRTQDEIAAELRACDTEHRALLARTAALRAEQAGTPPAGAAAPAPLPPQAPPRVGLTVAPASLESALQKLWGVVREQVTAELGAVDVAELEIALVAKVEAFLADAPHVSDMVDELLHGVRRVQSELEEKKKEEDARAAVQASMLPAPSPDAPSAPGPDLAAMASARSGGAPLPEKPVENAPADPASGAPPAGV